MRAGVFGSKIIQEGTSGGYRALSDLGHSVHEGSLLLILSVPMNGDSGVRWQMVDHVDDHLIVLTNADGRTRKLAVDYQRRASVSVWNQWGRIR